jgi:glycosyltransferase involved in cell wall biosynthesis
MKIILIHNNYQYYGGEETYFHSLVKLLKEHGHKVRVYTKDSKAVTTHFDKIWTAFGLFWNFKTSRELDARVKEFKPNVAHFNNIYPLIGATAYWVCKKNNIPIVQSIHNYRFVCPKGILFRKGKVCELCVSKNFPFWAVVFSCYHRSRIASLFFSLAFWFHKKMGSFNLIDQWIFPSEFTKQYYINFLKLNRHKTVFLPYYVEQKIHKKVNTKEDFYLFVGRLSEEKGIIELLDFFKVRPQISLFVAGTGPLHQKVSVYNQFPNIKLLKFLPRSKISEYLKKSRGLILSSKWYEVLPYVLLESAAQKTPIYALRNKNMDELAKKLPITLINSLEEIESIKLKDKTSFNIPHVFTKEYQALKLSEVYKKAFHIEE